MDLIRSEVERHGAIPFQRFMELALYAPGLGYYTLPRDPFGIHGDFFTASQLQPVFGSLIAQMIRPRLQLLNARTVVELGPGRGDMRHAFAGLDYVAVDVSSQPPSSFSGVIFANEFFDAHPVHLVRRSRAGWREVCVTLRDGAFVFAPRTRRPSAPVVEFLQRHYSRAPLGSTVEVNLHAAKWIRALSSATQRASFIIIDYGYTAPEWPRHAHGTLMSYHRHLAADDVLRDPGDRDITAHVAWTPLQCALEENGWRVESFTTLARALLDAGEPDQFASLFDGCGPEEQLRRRMQLKTLLFGMGETFRVMIASRAATQ